MDSCRKSIQKKYIIFQVYLLESQSLAIPYDHFLKNSCSCWKRPTGETYEV